ncbi:MAG: O-antigen ligase family protein [Spirochaetes bacterium]|nr:O-antigen ligase family protein [Spirochaetota bacterium]
MISILSVVTFIISVYLFSKDQEKSIKNFKIINLLILFLLFGFILSFIFSIDIKSSIKRLPIYLMNFSILFSWYYLFSIRSSINYSNKYRDFLINIILIYICIIINFIYILYSNNFSKALILSNRQYGFFRNAIAFGHMTDIVSLYLWFLWFLFIENKFYNNIKKSFYIFLWFLFIIFSTLQFFCLVISGSRTALLSFTFITAIFIFYFLIKYFKTIFILKKKKANKKSFEKYFNFITVILIVIIIISIFLFIPRINNKDKPLIFQRLSQKSISLIINIFKNPEISGTQSGSDFFRASAIIASFNIIKQRTITGTGPFAWLSYIRQKPDLLKLFNPDNLVHTHCHNEFLQVFTEFGLIYFLSYFALMIISFRNLIKNYILEKSFPNFLLICTFFYFILIGITDYISGHPVIGPFFWGFLGFSFSNK